MSYMTDLSIVSFQSAQEWEEWLAENHASSVGVWLRFFKNGSGKPTVTHDEALNAALCYGWIDGQGKKYDELSWLLKFTPRRAGSIWSRRNTEHVERLIQENRMQPPGFAEVEAAKADSRWERAYDSPSKMTVPEDFLEELSKNQEAKAFFETLDKANIYAIAWRLQTAKKPETREKRMNAILTMLAKGEKFHD
jgi:uncharacterized protein YdeI (YjbR/CyaY-like superfamily)